MADNSVYQGTVPEGERVGFCQDCGKPLTAMTVRTVGSGVFCEPCLERRILGVPAAAAASAGVPPYSAPNMGAPNANAPNPGPAAGPYFQGAYPPADGVFPPLDGSTPHPMLAGFLGLIPGVGAMYNGQFAKGFLHLIIFAVLVSLSDHVSDVFGLLVAGWVFFMAFEAYQTAKARRDGLPLPDVFGWNNIGDRIGLRNWTGGTPRPAANWNPPQPGATTQGNTGPAPGWGGYAPSGNSTATSAGTGGQPVTSAAYSASQYASAPAAEFGTQAGQEAGYAYTSPAQANPYAETYTGATPPADLSTAPIKRFPAGAMWLIGLGLLFLIGNLNSSFRVGRHWLLPVFLGGAAIWMFVQRFSEAERTGRSTAGLVCSLRGPSLLMTVAVLFALQAATWMTLGQTWPVFFIVLGGLLLLERTIGRSGYVAPPPASITPPVASASANPETSRWNAVRTPEGVKAGDQL